MQTRTRAVRDLGSTNGIRVNGMRVETGRLHPGDELSIAHLRYRFEDASDHDRFRTPPPIPSFIPPAEPVNPWVWVRPSVWGFGPLNKG